MEEIEVINGRIELSQEEKNHVLQVGAMNCPICGNGMLFLNQREKPEMYCDRPCHVSVPLWS